MRGDERSLGTRSMTTPPMLQGGLLALAAGLAACTADFHSSRHLEDMTCDDTGCWLCSRGDCEEYRCDETHQCPLDRSCSTEQRCVPGGGTGGRCDSHDDCGAGEICTLDGQCVTSPGGGPQDVVDASDASDITDASPPDAATACTFNGECGTHHACLEGTCYQRCQVTRECPAHTRCATGLCVADPTPTPECSGAGSCGGGKACVDGQCLAPCVDGACADGYVCDVGYCARAVSCTSAADCGGKDCVDGACVP